jgi:uncharacterized protein YegP (UPF0339 family)
MRVHTYRDRKGEWRWTLYARNGKKIACSGEGYRRRRDCQAMALHIVSGTLVSRDIERQRRRGRT